MSDEETDLRRRIVACIVRLDLVSHVSAKDYDAASSARDTSEAPGGRKPSHGGQDRPRGMEVVAFREDYRLHSADHFRRRLAKASGVKALRAILGDAEASLEAWQHSPRAGVNDPPPRDDPKWKQWVADSPLSDEACGQRCGVSRRYVNRIRADYRKGSDGTSR